MLFSQATLTEQPYGFFVVGDNKKPILLTDNGLYGAVDVVKGKGESQRANQILEELNFLYYNEHFRKMSGLEYPPLDAVDFIPISTFIADQWNSNESMWNSDGTLIKRESFHKMHSYIEGQNIIPKSPKPTTSEPASMCVKQFDKKYTTRKSPPYPANACKGAVMEGNDGRMYVSKPDKNGVYKWISRYGR